MHTTVDCAAFGLILVFDFWPVLIFALCQILDVGKYPEWQPIFSACVFLDKFMYCSTFI